jgi:hypothetical protein
MKDKTFCRPGAKSSTAADFPLGPFVAPKSIEGKDALRHAGRRRGTRLALS